MNTLELSPQNGELLSALADGELMQEEVGALFQTCEHNPAVSGSWNTYHAIGDVLRAPGSSVQLADSAFLARLNQQLAGEPSFGMRPRLPLTHSGAAFNPMPPLTVDKPRSPASNDSNFRWKMVAGFACVAAISAIAWNVTSLVVPAAGPQLAQSGSIAGGDAPQQIVVASPQGPMVRDARLEELLAAHKQLGATSALPVPSGFLRNATFETQQSLGR